MSHLLRSGRASTTSRTSGATRTGGYRRFAWTREDADLREWFAGEAEARGLDVAADRAGNLVAWWGDPDADGPGVVTGSHLDSVPDGGAFDGPLGVVSAFAALDALRADGFAPARPLGVACFGDEEGARFGVACAGSRILTGALTADRAAGLTDADGVHDGRGRRAARATRRWAPTRRRCAGSARSSSCTSSRDGRWPTSTGPSRSAPRSTRTAVGASTWPGRADHAGTTRLVDRDDPMLAFARVVLAARAAAERHGAVATCGKVHVAPNGVNAIPSHVTAWLDARGEDAERVRAVVADVARGRRARSPRSRGPTARPFDPALARRLAVLLDDAPLLPTGAGHDAGILAAAGVPDGDALRAQPDRRLAQPRGARRGRRLRRRRRRPDDRAARPDATARAR